MRKADLEREIGLAREIAVQSTRNGLTAILIAFFLFLSMSSVSWVNRQWAEPISPNPNPTEQATGETNLQIQEEIQVPANQPISLIGIIFISTGISWLLIRQLTTLVKLDGGANNDPFVTRATILKANTNGTGDDEVQLAEAIRNPVEREHTTLSIKISGQDEYFPLTRRQMKQGWRYLRQNIREGPKTEVDFEETINQVGRQGVFLEPLMRAPRSNRADLVLLLDQNGSMVPFQSLSQRLAETALRAGRLGKSGIYYFHNCPVRHLYHDPFMQNPESIQHFLQRRLASKSVVMIVSDAGAARSGFNPTRVERTKKFLNQLNQRISYVVWINPLPHNRWRQTTANEISECVPMFELNHAGFKNAIDVLRGNLKLSADAFSVFP